MRVALDLLYLVPGQTGGRETYARELIRAMRELEPDLDLTAIVGLAGREHGLPVERTVVLPVSARSRAAWAAGELALLPASLVGSRVDLLHCLGNFGPAGAPIPYVLTVHDMQYRVVPDAVSPVSRRATGAMLTLAARGARRVICGSHSAAAEVREFLPARHVDVVPDGPGSSPQPPRAEADLRRELSLGDRRVVLCPSSNLPHKNLPALLAAHAGMAKRPLLVLVGTGTDELSGDDVRGLGRVSQEALEGLYALAHAVVLPTLYEGFGLPALEALARGVAVACSDIPVLREVAGQYADYFDPHIPAEIAAALRFDTVHDPVGGRGQAARFTWLACAEGTLASYRRALAGG